MALAVPTLSLLFVLNKLNFLQYSVSGNSFPIISHTASTAMFYIIVSDFIDLITESLYSYQLLNSTAPGNLFSALFL